LPVVLSVYKKGQGTAARGTAAVVMLLLAGWASRQMWYTVADWPLAGRVIATSLVALLLGGVPVYLILFHQGVSELLIETQQEMRKVAWSSRAEVLGATLVVLVTVVLLAMFILVTDFVLLWLARVFGIY
jgi:preprotein translocase SecE subunit